MSFSTSAQLLDALKRMHLLEADQLAEAERIHVSRFGQPQALARELVQRGWLSPYQVNELFRGRGQGLVLGSYILVEKLGEGGMGAVYKARNWKLGQVVAIKLIRKDRLTHAGAVQRFQREIRAASDLNHPNIVRAFDADHVGDANFFVMEYVEGTDLAKIVKQHGPLPVATACAYIRQAALGLQHACERGMVHRDLKPANLLVASGGREPGASPHQGAHAPRSPVLVKILDMGLARRETYEGDDSSTLTQEGVVMGTPDYMSPEQALDSHLADIRADLYSLGCTFFFLLTGHVPFPGGTLTQKVMRHQLDNPPAVEQVRPEVPTWVGGIIRELLAKRPQDRFQTPRELVTALDLGEQAPGLPVAVPGQLSTSNPFAELGGGQTEIVQYTPMPSRRRPSRSRWLVTSAGTALIILLAVWIIVARRGRETTDSDDKASTVVTVVVDANRPWLDTGVDLQVGREVNVLCKNRWGKKDSGTCPAFGEKEAPRERNLATAEPAFCLLGRIGDQDPPFNLGALTTLTPDRGGRLFVRINHLDLAELTGSVQLEIRGRVQRLEDKAALPSPTRIERADGKLAEMRIREAAPETPRLELRRGLIDFRREYFGSYQASAAAELLSRLASPLDQLDPAKTPSWEIMAAGNGDIAKAPPGLVAVLGDCRWQHWRPIHGAAYSPDGAHLVTIDVGNDMIWWDAASGKPVRIFPRIHDAGQAFCSFSPDGKLLITAPVNGDSTVKAWDAMSGKEVWAEKMPAAFAHSFPIAWKQKDQVLAVGHGDGSVTFWESVKGKNLGEFETGLPRLCALALSPDGKWLAAGNGTFNNESCSIKLWDLSGSEPKEHAILAEHRQLTLPLVFAPDSMTFATVIGAKIHLWDLTGPQPREQAHEPFDANMNLDAVHFMPDGKRLLVLPHGHNNTHWFDWNGRELSNRRNLMGHRGLAWTSSKARLATHSTGQSIHQIDLGTLQEISPEKGSRRLIDAVAISPDGSYIASADYDGSMKIWNSTTAVEAWTAPTQTGSVWEMAYSPDGSELAVAGNHTEAKVLDAQKGAELMRFARHEGPIYGIAYGLDGKVVATAGGDKTVRLWERASGGEIHVLEGHANDVLGVAFRPDGQVVAGSGQDGSIRLWDAGTGKHLKTLLGHTGPVRRLAYGPDGKRIVSASYDHTARIWDPESGKVLHILEGHNSHVWCLSFSPDGATFVSGSENGNLILWDIASGKRLRQWQLPGGAGAVAFASDGRHLVTANRNGTSYVLRLGPPAFVSQGNVTPAPPSPYDSLQSAEIPSYEKKVAGGGDPDRAPAELVAILGDSRLKHVDRVQAVSFASAGKWVVSAGWDRIIRIWNATSGEEVSASSPLKDKVYSLAINRDGTSIAAGHENGFITIADVEGSRITNQLVFNAHGGRVSALAWSADGLVLASANWGKDKTVRLWEVTTGKKLAEIPHPNNILGLTFALEGKTLFIGSLTVHGWDLTDPMRPREGQAFKGIDGASCTRLTLSSDGKLLAAGFSNGIVKVWEAASGQDKHLIRTGKAATALAFDKTGGRLFVGTADGSFKSVELAEGLEAYSRTAHAGAVLDLACSPDGTRLVSAGEEGALRIWDADTGHDLLPAKGHTAALSRLAFSSDGSRIVTSSADRTLRVRDVKTGQDLATCRGHLQGPGSVAFDAAGSRLASSCPDGTIRVWDARSGQQSFPCHDSKQPASWVDFSPDGTRLAAGLNTGMAKVWDPNTGREIVLLEGHQKPVIHVGFSPDGKMLATASADLSVKIWDVVTGREQQSITGKQVPVAVVFLADGLRVAVAWADGNVRSYDWRTGQEDLAFKGLGGGVRALSRSLDGKYLSAATQAGRVLVWDVATAKKVNDWSLLVSITHCAIAPDSRHLVTANLNGTLFVLRIKGL